MIIVRTSAPTPTATIISTRVKALPDWRRESGRDSRASVLECASPLALFMRNPKGLLTGGWPSAFGAQYQSARGLAHSKTLRTFGRFMESSLLHVTLHAVAGHESLPLSGADDWGPAS